MSMAGQLSLLQSAAMLERASLLVSNDSAPMHLAGAVGTPVIAIFGATAPSYGFGPSGPFDRVVETPGLACRPCAIHGGPKCPIGTFECMERITPDRLLAEIQDLLAKRGPA
jgi:heptosyltransferase-2